MRWITAFALTCVISSVSLVSAQDLGRIEGRVIDDVTGFGIEGANVVLDPGRRGTVTGEEGRFEIIDLTPGSYSVTASYVGYEPAIENVEIEPGGLVTLEFLLHEEPFFMDPVTTTADRPFSTASAQTIRGLDLRLRPVTSSQDLLRVTPGLVTAQHAGGGKAEQIFLRGFDADHGTDVSISVDGVPVNLVSHGHGQGYADAHFIIPDVVDEVDVFLGPYSAEYGNLTTAGAVTFRTKDHLRHNILQVEGGSYETGRVTAMYQIPNSTEHRAAYVAAQYLYSNGPFESPQDFSRFNVYGKFHSHVSSSARVAISASAFGSSWDASGQVPQRAVDDGTITRFGAIDDLEGGTTSRQDLNAEYEIMTGDQGRFLLQGYVSHYDFRLYSNFTFYLDDPVNGDMIEQTDDRILAGATARYNDVHPLGSFTGRSSMMGGFRSDFVDVALWHSPNRVRMASRVISDLREQNFFVWAQEEVIFSPQWRAQIGLRADLFRFDVTDSLELSDSDLPHASGYSSDGIVSPKASLVFSPIQGFDLFANAGSGFHSNDARGVIIGERTRTLAEVYEEQGLSEEEIEEKLLEQNLDPDQRFIGSLPRAVGGELGFRTQIGRAANLAVAGWVLDLENEFVYSGDGGAPELSGATFRYGIDVEGRLRLARWLFVDANVNYSKGVLKDEPDGVNEIPLAPRLTSIGGLTYSTGGLDASLRYRHVDDRPANEDASVTAIGYTIVDLTAAYTFRNLRFSVQLENLLDQEWNEAQFATESRLRDEPEPVEELHFTPGTPLAARAGIAFLF